MAKKEKKVLVNTPVGEAIWPRLNEPDTKWKAEGEYSTKLAFDPEEPKVKAFVAKVEELVDAAFEKACDENPKFKKAMKRVSPIKNEVDDNGDETGRIVINLKKTAKVTSKKDGKVYTFRVMLYDANLQPLPKGIKIGGRSQLKASFEPYAYFNAKDKEAGISMRLEAVQVVELVEYKGKDGGSFGFETEEGGFDGSNLPERSDEGDEFSGSENEGGETKGNDGDDF